VSMIEDIKEYWFANSELPLKWRKA